jgi:hypothetical protein
MIPETFRAHIEGIVRPIGANFARKDQMREELLAGLDDLYEAAIAEGCCDEEAQRRALDGFGDPNEIRRDLQAAVPLRERILFCGVSCPDWVAGGGVLRRLGSAAARAHFRRPGESTVRHALRLSIGVGAFLAACLIPLLCITLALRFIKQDSMHRFHQALGAAGGLLGATLLATFLFVLIGHGIQRALEDRFWGRRSCCRLTLYGVLSSLAIFASGLVFLGIAWNVLSFSREYVVALACVTVATPFVIWAAIGMGLAEFRRFGEWGDIEEKDEGGGLRDK